MTHRLNPRKERIFPLKEIGKQLGYRIPYSTIFTWHRAGLVNPWTRQRVKISAIHMSYGLGTSIEEYWRFIDRLNQKPKSP